MGGCSLHGVPGGMGHHPYPCEPDARRARSRSSALPRVQCRCRVVRGRHPVSRCVSRGHGIGWHLKPGRAVVRRAAGARMAWRGAASMRTIRTNGRRRNAAVLWRRGARGLTPNRCSGPSCLAADQRFLNPTRRTQWSSLPLAFRHAEQGGPWRQRAMAPSSCELPFGIHVCLAASTNILDVTAAVRPSSSWRLRPPLREVLPRVPPRDAEYARTPCRPVGEAGVCWAFPLLHHACIAHWLSCLRDAFGMSISIRLDNRCQRSSPGARSISERTPARPFACGLEGAPDAFLDVEVVESVDPVRPART